MWGFRFFTYKGEGHCGRCKDEGQSAWPAMTDGMKRSAESTASGYFGEVDSEESESLPPREDLAEEPGNRRNGRLVMPAAACLVEHARPSRT